jgi:hypothetical protein
VVGEETQRGINGELGRYSLVLGLRGSQKQGQQVFARIRFRLIAGIEGCCVLAGSHRLFGETDLFLAVEHPHEYRGIADVVIGLLVLRFEHFSNPHILDHGWHG